MVLGRITSWLFVTQGLTFLSLLVGFLAGSPSAFVFLFLLFFFPLLQLRRLEEERLASNEVGRSLAAPRCLFEVGCARTVFGDISGLLPGPYGQRTRGCAQMLLRVTSQNLQYLASQSQNHLGWKRPRQMCGARLPRAVVSRSSEPRQEFSQLPSMPHQQFPSLQTKFRAPKQEHMCFQVALLSSDVQLSSLPCA